MGSSGMGQRVASVQSNRWAQPRNTASGVARNAQALGDRRQGGIVSVPRQPGGAIGPAMRPVNNSTFGEKGWDGSPGAFQPNLSEPGGPGPGRQGNFYKRDYGKVSPKGGQSASPSSVGGSPYSLDRMKSKGSPDPQQSPAFAGFSSAGPGAIKMGNSFGRTANMPGSRTAYEPPEQSVGYALRNDPGKQRVNSPGRLTYSRGGASSALMGGFRGGF